MEAVKNSFIGDDPGATIYGNFINYYSFHSAKERVETLHPDMFKKKHSQPIICLDIGCNTGELSKEAYMYLQNIYPDCDIKMLCIDIDSILIERAQETNSNPNIIFTTANIMNDSGKDVIMKYLNTHSTDCFDISFCFSVTMWIHINNGDEGLIDFLSFIQDISETIIVEPQPWKCYRNAQRRIRKSGSSFPLYEQLKIKNNIESEIENILKNTHKRVYEATASWDRKVQSYHRIH